MIGAPSGCRVLSAISGASKAMHSRPTVPVSPAFRDEVKRAERLERRYRRRLGIALFAAGGLAGYPVLALVAWLFVPTGGKPSASTSPLGGMIIYGLLATIALVVCGIHGKRSDPIGASTTPLTVAVVLGSLFLGTQVLFGLMAVAGDPVGFWHWAAPPIMQHLDSIAVIVAVPGCMLIASLAALAMGRRRIAWAMLLLALGMTLTIANVFPFGYFMRFAR